MPSIPTYCQKKFLGCNFYMPYIAAAVYKQCDVTVKMLLNYTELVLNNSYNILHHSESHINAATCSIFSFELVAVMKICMCQVTPWLTNALLSAETK